MNLTFECQACGLVQRTQIAPSQESLRCAGCTQERPLRAGAASGRSISTCLLCDTTDLYVQKDFPHRLGLTIVLVGIVLSSVAWAYYWYLAAIGILLATALLDLCLYYAIGDVLICYRCLAQYRGIERRPDQCAFDLGVGERYRQERIRLEKLRGSASAAAAEETGQTHSGQ